MDTITDPLADRDLQITLTFADGVEQTFTVVRDRGMRWRGAGTLAQLVAIDAAWFENPLVLISRKEDDNG